MQDQYFGVKELYEVVLRAKTPMKFGNRDIEADEPVLYFENISLATLNEVNSPIFARGGWGNLPHVIWEDRSEVAFTLSEGIMSNLSMSILFNSKVGSESTEEIIVNKREGPMQLTTRNYDNISMTHLLPVTHVPILPPKRKIFIFEYDKDVAQKKVYGKLINTIPDMFDSSKIQPYVQVYEDKTLDPQKLADNTKQYLIDYYYEYESEALVYLIQKERFNGLFSLEGKFYSKDENEGLNYTNIIYMPKVRVVSDINLRLGERANPTVGQFSIIGMPETVGSNKKGLLLEVTRLDADIDNII